MSAKGKYEFFWSNKSPFSNWHPSAFELDGIAFNCAEQAMMYRKAMLFNDYDCADRIMASTDPWEQKKLGRQVKGFTQAVWEAERENVMFDILFAKFSQNKRLNEALMSTGDKVLVEASPHDRIWGIGLPESDPRAMDEAQWKGLNLLGKTLNRVRESLTALHA
jgi:ribA/ribD-fused uncharacterized protein